MCCHIYCSYILENYFEANNSQDNQLSDNLLLNGHQTSIERPSEIIVSATVDPAVTEKASEQRIEPQNVVSIDKKRDVAKDEMISIIKNSIIFDDFDYSENTMPTVDPAITEKVFEHNIEYQNIVSIDKKGDDARDELISIAKPSENIMSTAITEKVSDIRSMDAAESSQPIKKPKKDDPLYNYKKILYYNDVSKLF